MKKLLVTGASGFLGWQICRLSYVGWNVIGTWKNHKDGLFPKTSNYQIDLTEKDAVWHMLKSIRPDAVFHLAANSNTGDCEKAPEKSSPINVNATAHLAEMCAEQKVKFLFTSSEQIFDGSGKNYRETDTPNPMNEYGKQKLKAENNLISLGTESIIVRVAVMFGKGSERSKSFLGHWVKNWVNHKEVHTFLDEIRSFLSGESAASALFHLLRQDASGVFHLGGNEAVSRTEFAEMAVRVLGLPKAKINSVSHEEAKLTTFRPKNLSLDCSKIKGTGFALGRMESELEKLKGQFDLNPRAAF